MRRASTGRRLTVGFPHGYLFKVYALDTVLDLAGGATKGDLLAAMEGHILGGGELTGEFVNKKTIQ